MNLIQEYFFLLDSVVIWAILIVATFCYGLLCELCFFQIPSEYWYKRTLYWVTTIKTILASLPLLGLLGTISGLLATFFKMSVDNGFDLKEVISGGIAEAMFTTQLGLVMVIPGLLMLSYLNSKRNSWVIRSL